MADDSAERWEVRSTVRGVVGYIDPEHVKTPAVRGKHPYHRPGRFAWYMVSGDEYGLVLRTLRGADLHVFAALPLVMRRDNLLVCKQMEIAEATGLAIPSISKAMKRLREEMVIGKIDGVLTFSPEIAWKGDVMGLWRALKLWREAKLGWIAERKAGVGEKGPSA